jgi:hypothetical protein
MEHRTTKGEVHVGDVYTDTRTHEEYLVTNMDEQSVLVKYIDDLHDDTRARSPHPRDQFENEVEEGRWKFERVDTDTRSSWEDEQDNNTNDEESESDGPLQDLVQKYEDKEGRKASHKAEALAEASELLRATGATDGSEQAHSPDEEKQVQEDLEQVETDSAPSQADPDPRAVIQAKLLDVMNGFAEKGNRKAMHKAEALAEILPYCTDTEKVRRTYREYDRAEGRTAEHKATVLLTAIDCIEREL